MVKRRADQRVSVKVNEALPGLTTNQASYLPGKSQQPPKYRSGLLRQYAWQTLHRVCLSE